LVIRVPVRRPSLVGAAAAGRSPSLPADRIPGRGSGWRGLAVQSVFKGASRVAMLGSAARPPLQVEAPGTAAQAAEGSSAQSGALV